MIALLFFVAVVFLLKYYKKKSTSLVAINGTKVIREPFECLLIQNPSICLQVYAKDTIIPENLGLGNLFNQWLGYCLGNLNVKDPAWSTLKKIFRPLFNIEDGSIVDLIDNFDCNLKILAERSIKTNRPITIEEIVNDLPLKYILRLIFGQSFLNQYLDKFVVLQKCANALMFNIFNNKQAKYKIHQIMPTKINKTLKQFENEWNFILRTAKNSESVKKEGIFSQLYQNYIDSKGKVTYKMFSQTLIEIIYANQDVVVPSLMWLMVYYARYGNEMDNINWFIEESARMSPIFPMSMPKITTSDININGEIIKKGTTVSIDFINIGKSSEWDGMDDLDKFRPNRFDNIAMQQFVSRFGYGGRKCPGHKLANNLFIKVLEYLKDNWVFVPVDKRDVEIDKTKAFISPLMNIWIMPKSFKLNDRTIYYNCPPHAEQNENAFVGISVNKKSPYLSDSSKADMLVKYLSEKYAELKREIVILIVDEIAQLNIQAFEGYNENKARNEATKLGDLFMKIFNGAIERHGSGKIKLCRWVDLKIPNMVQILRGYDELNKRVSIIANNFLNKRGQGLINTSYARKISLVEDYIFSELSVLVCGIKYDEQWYRLMYYSGSKDHFDKFAGDKNSLHNLVIDIIHTNEFANVRNKIFELMGTNKCKVSGFIGFNID
jgi:cytochrome P450